MNIFRLFLVIIFIIFIAGCTSMGEKSFVTLGDQEQTSTIICDRIDNIILADEELQISHLNGENIGGSLAWPDKITVDAGVHIINLRYRHPIGFDLFSKVVSLDANKKYDKSFKVTLEAGKTYIAKFKPIMESTFFGPKRIDVKMWVEDKSTGKEISVRVDPIHKNSVPIKAKRSRGR